MPLQVAHGALRITTHTSAWLSFRDQAIPLFSSTQSSAAGRPYGQTGDMTADALALISVDPLVCRGQACLKGTRIPVSIMLDCLSDGMTLEQILDQYRSLSVASIRAAAAYGAELAREELLPLTGDR